MEGPDRGVYANSRIDWEKLRRFAVRVAKETRVARRTHAQTTQVTKTREVRGGFLGLSRRTESYTVPVTKTLTEDHWVLEQRYWKKYENGSGSMADETSCEMMYYCLGTDGSLFVRVESWEEVSPKGMAYFENRHEPTVKPMDDNDVVLFDFEPKRYYTGGRTTIDTDRDPDKLRLKYDAKGIGLSLALKRLLERAS